MKRLLNKIRNYPILTLFFIICFFALLQCLPTPKDQSQNKAMDTPFHKRFLPQLHVEIDPSVYEGKTWIKLGTLDELGRCTGAEGVLGEDTLATETRTSIGMIKPTGWQTIRYDDLIEDKYLYNRCHLIAYCLSGLNANEENLITGTRYLNVELMLPIELQVLHTIQETGYHVFYRVQPRFQNDELVARSVLLEAYTIEDEGKTLSICTILPNVQPGIYINYMDGSSHVLQGEEP